MMTEQKIYILIVVLLICIYTCDKIYMGVHPPPTHTRVHLKLNLWIVPNVNVLVLVKILIVKKTKGTQTLTEPLLQFPINL